MPISFDFRETDSIDIDYSGRLENLHVYGDFLSLFSLPTVGTIAEIGNIFNDLKRVDKQIFCIYVSYVLSKAGFYLTDILNPDFIDSSGNYPHDYYSTNFKEEDWVSMALSGPFGDIGWGEEIWPLNFENEEKNRIRIFFVNKLYSPYDPPSEFIQGSSYFVINPRLFRKEKEWCEDFAEQLRKKTEYDLAFSTGQFVVRYLPDEKKRGIVEANWEYLRERILVEFQKKWKILVFCLHKKEVDDSYDNLRKARLKLESGNELEGAVLDAAIACEGLLKTLHSTRPKRTHERMVFDEYLSDLSDLLTTEDFGEDILYDLKWIRDWRNRVADAPRKIPDSITALKIVTKAELFQKLFDKYLKK